MAQTTPKTSQEAMMGILQQIAAAMAAPDANLEELAELQKQTVASIRKPYDTPSPGTPVGASMDMSAGAAAPAGPAPGELSPMLAALMGGAGGGTGGAASPMPGGAPAAAGSFPVGSGVMARPQPPNMDEVRRIIHPA